MLSAKFESYNNSMKTHSFYVLKTCPFKISKTAICMLAAIFDRKGNSVQSHFEA